MNIVTFSRRRMLQLTGGAAATLAAGSHVHAQAWPTKPVTLMVGFAPGGITDALARLVAPMLSDELKQPVIVENRAGASSSIATAAVAAAPKDGYTFLVVSNGHAHIKHLIKGIKYDPVADFEPVGGIAQNPLLVLVNASAPYRSINDLVAAGRGANGLAYGHGGIGTLPHLIPEMLAKNLKTHFVNVAYRGSAPAIVDLMSNQVGFVMDLLQTSLPFVQAGKLRAVAVTSGQRAVQLPDVPTLSETVLPGLDAQGFYGLLAPAGTPRDVIAKMHAALLKVMKRPDMQERLRSVGSTAFDLSPAEFMTFIRNDGKRWSELIVSLGIQPE
jgi:tripartite-type tricarboxylate transporter receptor subunit TctC